jgi:hypothetical protein
LQEEVPEYSLDVDIRIDTDMSEDASTTPLVTKLDEEGKLIPDSCYDRV